MKDSIVNGRNVGQRRHLHHYLFFENKYGNWFKRKVITRVGLMLFRSGREILKATLDRCPVCGGNPGMGTISRYGHLCNNYYHNCHGFWDKIQRGGL